ncbi:hypothetical protein SARC_08187 [Sphaeroforma arctica JP610]|uniref:Zinc finger PHD-type domain-containing protein n=1 Tax=Sphaeroforma arctica JP610 TaxID=667725 RepID=A0A0L0FRM1_9EUKA|nr:hypothetical protein SARC_08187 [Sphaeroforma arctica JP610]KNC79420.1 hypothetical protein SARC_08187 [Sphaeroforma arctica JP610]|eukprot:XP_014153322.1 hypothetical protein SARC_08187 [Sphaeroforma arctica JP610]
MVNHIVVSPVGTAASLSTSEDVERIDGVAKCSALAHINTKNNRFNLDDKVLISLVPCIPVDPSSARHRQTRNSVPPHAIHSIVEKETVNTGKPKQKEKDVVPDGVNDNGGDDDVCERVVRNNAKRDDGFQKNGAVEVYDATDKLWYRTRIIEINRDRRPPTIRIHYPGFSKIFDEDISFYSARLRPAGSGSVARSVGANVRGDSATNTRVKANKEEPPAVATTKAEPHGNNSLVALIRPRKRTISNTSTNTGNNHEASTRGRKQAPSVEPERKHSGTNGNVHDSGKGSAVPGPSSVMSRFLYSRKRSRERSDDFDSARNARKRSASISSAELTKSHVSNGSSTHDTVNGHSESTVGAKRPRRTGAGSAALKSLFSYGRNMGDVKIDLEALEAEERERNGSENEKHGPGENDSIAHRTHVVPGNRPKSSGGGLRATGAGHTRGQGKQSIGGKPRQRHTSTSESVEGANDAVGRPVRERRMGNGSSALNSLFSYGPTMGDVVIDFAALETEEKEAEEKAEERRLKKPTRQSAESKAVDEGSGPDSTDMPQDGSNSRRKVQYTKNNRDSKVKARDIRNRISEGKTCKASARSRSQDTSSSTSAAVSDGATERVPRVRRRTGNGRAALKSLFSYGRTMGDVVIDTTLLKEEVDDSDKIDASGSEDKEKGRGSSRSKVGRVSSQVTSVGEKGGSARSAQNRSQPRGQGNKHERSLHKAGKASESGQESEGGVSGRRTRCKQEIERHARDTTRGANGREDRTDVRGRSVSADANGVGKERGGGLVRERVQPKRGSLGDDAKNSLFVDHPPWWEETVTLETGYDLSDEEVGDENEGDGESCDESLTMKKGQRTRTARSISTSSLTRGRNGTHTRIQARSRRKEGTNTGGKARTRTQSEAASAGASKSVGHSRTRTKSAGVEVQVDTEHNTKRSERPKRGLLGDEAKNALFIDHPPWYEATITLDTIDKLGGLDAFDGDVEGEEGTVAKAGSRKSSPHESGSEVDCKSGSGTETDSETESDECRPGRGCAVANKRVHESDNSEGAVESAGAPEGTREGDCAKGGAERKAMESHKQKIKDWASQERGTVGTSSASDMVGDVRDGTCTEPYSGVHGPEQSADAGEGAQQAGRGAQHGEAQTAGTSGRNTPKHVQETRTASVDTQAAAAAPGPVLTSASPTVSGNSPRGDERVQSEGKATGKVGVEPTSPVDVSARLAKVSSRPHESGHDRTAAEGYGANEACSRVVDKVNGDVGINDMDVDGKTNPVANTDASSILPEDSSRASPLITEDTKSKSSTSNANKEISSATQDMDGAQAATTAHFENVSTQVNNTNSDGTISMPPSSDHPACSTDPHNAANISKLGTDGNWTKQAPRDSNYTPAVDATAATADASTTLATDTPHGCAIGAFGTVAAASHEDDAVVEEGSLDGTLASVNLTSHKRHHWTPQALAMAMQGQHVGGHVFARWVDGVFYPVRVVGGTMSDTESNSDPASVEVSVKPSVGVSVTSDKAELDRRHSDSRGAAKRLGESVSGLSECRHSNKISAASGLKLTAGDQAAEASTTSGADTNGRLTIGESEKANSALKVNGWLYYDVDFRPILDSADSLEPLQKTASQDRNTNINAAQQQSQLSSPPPLLKLPTYITNTNTTTDANINTTTGTNTATTTGTSTSTGLNTNTTTNAIAANLKSMHVKRVPWTDIIVPDAALEAKVSENTRRDTKRGIKRARALQRNKDGSLDGRTAAARALKMSKLGKGVSVGTYRAGTSKHTKVCVPNVNSRGDADASAVTATNVIGGTDEGRSMRMRRNTTVSVSEGAEKETVPGHPRRSAGAVATGTPTDVNGSGAASVSGGEARRPARERGVGKSGGAGQKLRQSRLGAQQPAGASEQEAAVLAVATSGIKPATGEIATDGAVVKPQSAGEDSASTRGSQGVASQAPATGVYGTKRPVRTRTQGIKRPSDAAKKEPMADTSATAAAVAHAASPAVRGRRVSRSVSESSTHRASREHSSGKHARAQPKAKGAADVSSKADASSLSSTAAASTVGGANGEVSTSDRRVSGKSVLPHLPVLMTSRGKIDGRSSAARGASMIARVSAMNARASGRGARAGGQRSRQSRHMQQAAKHTAAETQTGAARATSTHLRHRHSSVSSQSSASGRQAAGKGLELDREVIAVSMLSGTGGRVRSRHSKDLAWGSNAGGVNDSLRSDGPLNMRRTKSEAVASSNDKSGAGASYKTSTGTCAATDMDTPWSAATSRKTSTHKPPMVERHVQCMCGGVAIVGKGMQCATCEHWSHDACVQLSARARQSATTRAEISTGTRSAVASPFTCFRCVRVPNPLLFRAEEILSEDLLPACATAAQLRSSVLNEGQAVHRAGAKSSTNVMPAQKPSHIRSQMSEPPMQGHPHASKCRLDGPRSMTELGLALPQTYAQTTGAEAHGQRLDSGTPRELSQKLGEKSLGSTCTGVTAPSIPPQACAHTHSPGSASANEEQPVRGPEPPPSRTVPFTQSTQTLNLAPHSGNSASVLATATANACVSVREDEAPQRRSFDHTSSPGIGLGAGMVRPLTTTISSDHAVPVTDAGQNYSTATHIAPFSGESNAGQTSAGGIRTKCDDPINTLQTTSNIKDEDDTWDSTLPRNPGSGPEYIAQKDLTEIASAVRVDLASRVAETSPTGDCVRADAMSSVNAGDNSKTYTPRAVYNSQATPAVTDLVHTRSVKSAQSDDGFLGNRESFSSSPSPPIPLSPTPSPSPTQSPAVVSSAPFRAESVCSDITMLANTLVLQPDMSTRQRTIAADGSGVAEFVDAESDRTATSDLRKVHLQRASTWQAYNLAKSRLRPVTLAVNACAHQLSRCRSALLSLPETVDMSPQLAGSSVEPIVSDSAYSQSQSAAPIEQSSSLINERGMPACDRAPPKQNTPPPSKLNSADYVSMLEQIEYWQETLLQNLEDTRGLISPI